MTMFKSFKVPSVQGRRALLVLNCQKDSMQLASNPSDFLERICHVIPYYRKAGTEIVWINTEMETREIPDRRGETSVYDLSAYHASSKLDSPSLDSDLDDSSKRASGTLDSILAEEEPKPALKRHAQVNDLVDELAALQDRKRDIIITKRYYSAFDETPLLTSLRMKMVTCLHLCGGLSNVSVLNTAADAAQHGFEVSVVEDCLSYRSEKQHLDAMQKMADSIGVSGVDSDEIVEEVGPGSPSGADPSSLLGPGLSRINLSANGSTRSGNGNGHEGAAVSYHGASKKKAKHSWINVRQPHTGPIGEGDAFLHLDALSSDLSLNAFDRLKSEVDWQIMRHRTGEVPRRVAVQGEVGDDGSVPVYRHPADESPPLLPFTKTVRQVRDECEKLLGQSFNHALVQLYRDGQDNIGEHSDKTLDILRGSSIVNVSFGAERTMILRLKKAAIAKSGEQQIDSKDVTQVGAARESQRIPLPHSSVFVLGLKSNDRWLHAIKADKRLENQKNEAEMAFGGERISLTFRNIDTFTNAARTKIWGQGAKSKVKAEAGEISASNNEESERMLAAFGKENQSANFNWNAEYGPGFDALDLVVVNRPVEV